LKKPKSSASPERKKEMKLKIGSIDLSFGNVSLFPPTLNWDFMKWRWLWIGLSGILVVLSLSAVAIKGINYSIDFTGGVEITMNAKQGSFERSRVVAAAEKTGVGTIEVTSISALGSKKEGAGYLLRVPRKAGMDEATVSAEVDKISQSLRTEFGADQIDLSYASVSGKVGKEEQRKGYMSILLSLVSILIYVAWRFDPRFAPGAVICLFHDVIIALGFMTALGRPFANTSIAAFLTIVGYSVTDTIIVYDRIREIRSINPRMELVDVVNRSINQTMSRTVLTQVTVLIALIVMVIWGGGAIHDFALTMLIGVMVGSYSSIYVAAPLTLVLDAFLRRRGIVLGDGQKAVKEEDPNYIPPVIIRKRAK
jgi:preprotein translocase subunit SecF